MIPVNFDLQSYIKKEKTRYAIIAFFFITECILYKSFKESKYVLIALL